jgi:drug/metabolite transporter (DMT)-like permease
VLAIDYLYYGRKASPRVTASVLVVCLGVGLATITDPEISSNLAGLGAGFGSVGATALYQIWAGSKQKELGLGSMQLLHQYVPLAAGLLAILVSEGEHAERRVNGAGWGWGSRIGATAAARRPSAGRRQGQRQP